MRDHEITRQPASGHSRRAFLKGSGAAAAATALATGSGMAQAAETTTTRVASVEMAPLTLNVNGQTHDILVEPRMTLLEALRYRVNLTGAKPVSHDGSCGASTVLIDGKPQNATTTLAMQCKGKKIVTVESLGGASPDPVVTAFVHNDGMQCGFCTPSFVLAVRTFLNNNPKATEQDIRAGLNGNLCRCGTYVDVIRAALEVVKGGSNG